VWILLTHSVRGDIEAWLTGCRQRFGIVHPGRLRPLLSHRFLAPASGADQTRHQLELWEEFLRHFGLAAPLDRAPLQTPDPCHAGSPPIGLIPGSENNPEKRWPVEHWKKLVESLPGEQFVLFGTAGDLPITSAIAAKFSSARVENAAGMTDLPTFAERLRACRLLITNDTGGMHLANGLGVPLIALFGPTNPLRTGPVFAWNGGSPAGNVRILQPPGCPPEGGGNLRDLDPATVAGAARELLAQPAARV
jgi:ADP-heptose:LPS heptosyltransferase